MQGWKGVLKTMKDGSVGRARPAGAVEVGKGGETGGSGVFDGGAAGSGGAVLVHPDLASDGGRYVGEVQDGAWMARGPYGLPMCRRDRAGKGRVGRDVDQVGLADAVGVAAIQQASEHVGDALAQRVAVVGGAGADRQKLGAGRLIQDVGGQNAAQFAVHTPGGNAGPAAAEAGPPRQQPRGVLERRCGRGIPPERRPFVDDVCQGCFGVEDCAYGRWAEA